MKRIFMHAIPRQKTGINPKMWITVVLELVESFKINVTSPIISFYIIYSKTDNYRTCPNYSKQKRMS